MKLNKTALKQQGIYGKEAEVIRQAQEAIELLYRHNKNLTKEQWSAVDTLYSIISAITTKKE